MKQQSNTAFRVRPSIESYNAVLEAWAYSNEHLKGTMADRQFSQLLHRRRRGLSPNGDSYKFMIRAWTQGNKQDRAAFIATGHLMKMLRQLEKDWPDMEPSMEHYHLILKAWTEAK